MKLYTVPFAPNPTKVALYLSEREVEGHPIAIDHVIVNLLKGEQRSSEHLARNPFGTLPVLELDDGTYLIESLSIIDYFETAFPQGALLPAEVEARALARDMERIVETRLSPPLFEFIHASNSPLGNRPDPDVAAKAFEQLALPLDFLETVLADGRSYLTGAVASTADISLAAYLNFARITRNSVLGERVNLRGWRDRYLKRPAAQLVLNPTSH